jgi:hypothetical protein
VSCQSFSNREYSRFGDLENGLPAARMPGEARLAGPRFLPGEAAVVSGVDRRLDARRISPALIARLRVTAGPQDFAGKIELA